VRARTALVNTARGLAKSYGERLRGCNVRNINPEKAEGLSPELQSALEPLLACIESVSEQIREYNERIEKLAQESYPQVALLKQIKGVGTLIALTFMLTLEDPTSAKKAILDLRRWGLKLAERGGKSGKKRAIVATARKLAVLLHHLWVSGEVYQPLHNNQSASMPGSSIKSKSFLKGKDKIQKPSSGDCVNRLARVSL
jgi:transposase